MSTKKRDALFGLVLLFALLSSFLLERIIQNSDWSLVRSGQLLSSKIPGFYRKGLMGTVEFVEERQALAGGSLNLGEWHGHNELSLREPISQFPIQLIVKIPQQSYLWIYFDQNDLLRRGVRISRHPHFSSGLFTVDDKGIFSARQTVPVRDVEKQTIELMEKSAEEIQIRINGEDWISTKLPTIPLYLTIRNGHQNVYVESIKIGGQSVDGISPELNLNLMFKIFMGFAALAMIAGLLAKTSLAPLSLFFFTSLIFFTYWQLDRSFFARLYPYASEQFIPEDRVRETSLHKIDKVRRKFFQQFQDVVPTYYKDTVVDVGFPLMIRGKPYDRSAEHDMFTKNTQWIRPDGTSSLNPAPAKSKLVIFLGTSQAWGAGASSDQNTWFGQIISKLNQDSKIPIYGFNLSICGSRLHEVLTHFRKQTKNLSYQAVVANFGTNDGSTKIASFQADLEALLKETQTKSSKLFMVVEAKNIEVSRPNSGVHKLIREFSVTHQLSFVDSNAYFYSRENYDRGNLWWDVAHYDDGGHTLMADLLIRELPWSSVFKLD